MIDTDPLYANFTSGSTGTPKGVVVSHRSVLDFIDVFAPLFHITDKDRIANQAPFDFDVSVKDIYSAVKTGATLVIVPKALFSRPVQLLDYLCENRVTTLIWAVSALCLITTFHGLDYRVPETVQKVLFSGEVMPVKHLANWRSHLPHAMFVNLYGPTEITCNCTYHILQPGRGYKHGIPIGQAFPNEHVFLLDEQNQLVTQPGMEGEICVRGTALALGYFKAPEQTAAAFTQNPLQTWYPERIYRTGDLGRYGEGGDLYFAGRKDFQIKHMGHRIELKKSNGPWRHSRGLNVAAVFSMKRSRSSLAFISGTGIKKNCTRSCVRFCRCTWCRSPISNGKLPADEKRENRPQAITGKEGAHMTETAIKALCKQHATPFMYWKRTK